MRGRRTGSPQSTGKTRGKEHPSPRYGVEEESNGRSDRVNHGTGKICASRRDGTYTPVHCLSHTTDHKSLDTLTPGSPSSLPLSLVRPHLPGAVTDLKDLVHTSVTDDRSVFGRPVRRGRGDCPTLQTPRPSVRPNRVERTARVGSPNSNCGSTNGHSPLKPESVGTKLPQNGHWRTNVYSSARRTGR